MTSARSWRVRWRGGVKNGVFDLVYFPCCYFVLFSVFSCSFVFTPRALQAYPRLDSNGLRD
jgi:hypothetical protein